MTTTPDTIGPRLGSEALAILERIAVALEALVQQQKTAPPGAPAPPAIGPFLGEE